VDVCTWSVRRWSEPLTLRALLHVVLDIVEHLRPVLSLVDDLVGERAASQVVSTVAIVDFLHHILSFFWYEASQIRVGVEIGVGSLV